MHVAEFRQRGAVDVLQDLIFPLSGNLCYGLYLAVANNVSITSSNSVGTVLPDATKGAHRSRYGHRF